MGEDVTRGWSLKSKEISFQRFAGKKSIENWILVKEGWHVRKKGDVEY